jgi:methionine-rich copper-binding protein CopC
MRKSRRYLFSVIAAVLLGSGITLAAAGPAQAHDDLLGSFQDADSTVAVSPDEITLSFSGELISDMQSAVIEVTAPGGENIATDAPTVSGTTITQHLEPNPPDGAFTVLWRVVSGDGHPISGEYTYTVEPIQSDASTPGAGATEQAPEPSITSAETTTNTGGSEPFGGVALLPILAVLTGVIILGAGFIVVFKVTRERRLRNEEAVDRQEQQDSERTSKDASHEK